MGRRRRRTKPADQPSPVRVNGRRFDVIDRLRVRGRLFLVLKRIAPIPRERLLVCDPSAGMQLRLMLRLPNDDATTQHLSVLKDLNNRHLPQIHEFERTANNTLIVLSYTTGIDLDQYLRRIESGQVRAPTPTHAVRLIHGIANSLTTLHRHARIIHGDLKPANLVITRKPSHLSLIDFGSAWPIERTGFRHFGDGFSPAYAAPEQQSATQAVDERADQFAASVLLYQMLTLKVPYDGLGGQAGLPRFFDARNVPVPPSELAVHPRHLPVKLRRRVDNVVLQGLALDPSQRFQTSGAWLDALRAVHLQLELRESESESTSSYWSQFCDWIAESISRRHKVASNSNVLSDD